MNYLSVVVALIFLSLSNVVKADTNITFVDMDKIISTSKPGLFFLNQLKELNDKNIEKFTKSEKILKAREKKIIAQKNIISEEIFRKEIEILKLVITGTLLSLLTIAINKFLGFNLHIINIISIIVSIFVFLILIRVIINMNKKKLNFREFNYAKSPKEYGFFDKLSKLLSDLIPSFKLRESESHNSQIIPSGNI